LDIGTGGLESSQHSWGMKMSLLNKLIQLGQGGGRGEEGRSPHLNV